MITCPATGQTSLTVESSQVATSWVGTRGCVVAESETTLLPIMADSR